MFWLDRVFEEAQTALKDKIAAGKTLVVRDEKTASGRVHVGSLRALALHAAMADRLGEAEIPHVFKYEINDFDPMDGLPVYLDASVFGPHMGESLYYIPSPDPAKASNFPEYFGTEYKEVIEELGYHPEFYRASELYLSGKMNDVIREALDDAPTVRKIYKEVSGSDRPDTWFPLSVICENCGKIGTTRVTAWDGERVTYECLPKAVEWAEGCGHHGIVSPFDGKAKLPWKVEWPAKWKVVGVDIEGGGKDHYSRGGARDVARRISEEVFKYPEPFGVPNEFFLVGGKKMSSSKGAGSSAREVANLVPPHILRLALLSKDINQQTNFDPAGETIPMLFDQYDKLATSYWEGIEDDGARLFLYIHPKEDAELFKPRYLMRFSMVAFVIQMPHLSLEAEAERLKGEALTDLDRAELTLRATYARRWLEQAADDEYKFVLAESEVPELARGFSSEQKAALTEVLAYIKDHDILNGPELHARLHDIRKASGLSAQEFFGALYLSFLGKPSGPQAGWFLSALDRTFLVKRLTEVLA